MRNVYDVDNVYVNEYTHNLQINNNLLGLATGCYISKRKSITTVLGKAVFERFYNNKKRFPTKIRHRGKQLSKATSIHPFARHGIFSRGVELYLGWRKNKRRNEVRPAPQIRAFRSQFKFHWLRLMVS